MSEKLVVPDPKLLLDLWIADRIAEGRRAARIPACANAPL
jgi:hypothetical protein